MPDAKELVKKYLNQVNIMQLATSVGDLPWACNLHFYADDDLNLYWISTEARRHSQEIASNPNVAAAILAHENSAEEDYVIGVSVSGTAELLEGLPEAEVAKGFINKHNHDSQLLDDIANGKNPHRFYKLTPRKIVLFDSKNFPETPRQEVL